MSFDYGEMMAEAAGAGFDGPEEEAAARRRSRLEREHDIHFPDLEEAGNDSKPDTQQKETREPNRSYENHARRR